jgi:salicylate hydroxylase
LRRRNATSAAKRFIATIEVGANRGRDITVIGGGIGGLTAALAFARTGAKVTVLEQAPAIAEVGAGLQITPNGAVVLDALGLGPDMAERGIRAMAVEPMDAVTGRPVARFDLTTLKGSPYRFFHRADLIDMLARACVAAGVNLRTGARVASVTAEGVVTLQAGEALRPVLAVGADGIHSVLRPVLNGADRPFFTGQVAWRAVVVGDHAPVARIWMAPGRHVVTYPLTGGRVNIVAVREQDGWADEGWNVPDDPDAFRAVFADLCPELRAILARVDQVRLWGLFRHPVAPVWHGAGAALLGDAAHPTLPFLAQGANLAIEDAFVLAACCDADASVARALTMYQSKRQARVARAIAAANANAVNYHLSGVRRAVAHAGLRALGAVAPGAFLGRMDWLYGADVTRG